ncbi:MAG: replication initiator protein [Microviridae sp.]|nr:MAG: replication initiator protein [Microviridae sp.]
MRCLYSNIVPDAHDYRGNPIYSPCGHCFACRLSLQTSLVNRMWCAWKSHSCAAFVTFTYSDEFLPIPPGINSPSLCKDDVHKYLDKIRHFLKGYNFEYFLCGEYGDSFGRPHYHCVFFGLDYEKHSKFFKSSWKKGSVKVLPVTAQSFRYVSKYLTANSNKNGYFDLGIEPPFYKMSRGLGVSMYLKHLREIRENGYFVVGSRRIYPNKYYFNKFVQFNSDLIDLKDYQFDERNLKLLRESQFYNADFCSYEVNKAVNLENNSLSKFLNNKS